MIADEEREESNSEEEELSDGAVDALIDCYGGWMMKMKMTNVTTHMTDTMWSLLVG